MVEKNQNDIKTFIHQDQKTRWKKISELYGINEDKDIQNTKAILKHVTSPQYGSSFVQTMLGAMVEIGCPVDIDTHISIEECDPDSNLFGVFDQENNQIVLCQNKFRSMHSTQGKQRAMEHLLSHELIHAYDHCRANANFYDAPEHMMCSEIRAAALSGECMLKYNKIDAVFDGFSGFHKTCVKSRAMGSFMAVHKHWAMKDAENLFASLFPSCYGDRDPFDRHSLVNNDANLSYKAFLTRNRYTVF